MERRARSLDTVLAELGIDWLVAWGSGSANADIAYLTGRAPIGHTLVVKPRGGPVHCVVGVMEREEARAAQLAYSLWNDYGAAERSGRGLSPAESRLATTLAILRAHEVKGRCAFVGSGKWDAGYSLLDGILGGVPEICRVELDPNPVAVARMYKTDKEVAAIRDVGERTRSVVETLLGELNAHARGDVVLNADASVVTVGQVKRRLALLLAEHNLDDLGATIFAPGREAGFPHSRGAAQAPVAVNQTIIFDIFPRCKQSGYFFDTTRTLWWGEVSARAKAGFDAVYEAFEAGLAAVSPGVAADVPDRAACAVFEKHGFVTKVSQPDTTVGYMHGLGHGLGLDVHEQPSVSTTRGRRQTIEPGMVFTIEPGLYFPDEGWGARIEDTVWMRPDGQVERLASLPVFPQALLPLN